MTLELLAPALERDPGDGQTLNSVVEIHLQRGEPALALSVARAAVERAPDMTDAWSGLADVLLTLHCPEGAIAAADRSIEVLPLVSKVRPQLQKAAALNYLGRFPEAIAVCEKSLEFGVLGHEDRDYAPPQLAIARNYVALADADHARIWYARALDGDRSEGDRLGPEDTRSAHLELRELDLQAKDLKAAYEHLAAAMGVKHLVDGTWVPLPTNARQWQQRAYEEALLKMWPESKVSAEEGLARDPGIAELYMYRGNAAWQASKDEALMIEDFEKALAIGKDGDHLNEESAVWVRQMLAQHKR
jgi:tetratricopeptide (TPR) repeat protein